MPTVNEILNFNFSAAALQQAARTSFPASITRLHEVRINKLKKITEEVGESSFKFTGETLIPQVFKKFKNIMKTGGLLLENFERRELRTLTYSLSHSEQNSPQIFSKPNELDFVFETLETSWKDSYLIGLIDCYLKNWETNHTSSAEKLGNFIFKKLRNYDGNRTVLKSLKSNMKYFDGKNGDAYLGSELAKQNKQIKEATKFLSLPENWFAYPYFSKVILAYYVVRKNDVQQFIEDLNNALHEHNNSTSNKRLVSKLIIQANANEFVTLQDKVKSIAFKLVGDPGKASHWIEFEGATESEKDELKQARRILNEWITREFITVFFEVCINDSRRKKFWLKYAKSVSNFKVFGPSFMEYRLKQDKRITEYVEGKYQIVSDEVTAIVMDIGNHRLIEYNSWGFAFYAYLKDSPKAPSLDVTHNRVFQHTRSNYKSMLVYRSGRSLYHFSDEGRLTHNDGDLGWEEVFAGWLERKVLPNV